MSTLKTYSKQAKERLKNGFWQEKKQQLTYEKEVAATLGIDSSTVVQQQRDRVSKEIYKSDEYAEELEFQNKVVQILQSDKTVLNPLQLLADEKLLETLNIEEKQRYFLKLSQRYQEAVEKYNKSK